MNKSVFKGAALLILAIHLTGCGGESYEIRGGGGLTPAPTPTPTAGCTSNCGSTGGSSSEEEFLGALEYDVTLRAPALPEGTREIDVDTDSLLKVRLVARSAPNIQGLTAYNCMTVRTAVLNPSGNVIGGSVRTGLLRRPGATQCLVPPMPFAQYYGVDQGISEQVINFNSRLTASGSLASYKIRLDDGTNDYRCYSTNTYFFGGLASWLYTNYNCSQSSIYNPGNGQPSQRNDFTVQILTNGS